MTKDEVIKSLREMANQLDKTVTSHKQIYVDYQNLTRNQIAQIGPILGDLPKVIRYLQRHYPNMVESIKDWDDKLNLYSKQVDEHLSIGDTQMALSKLQKFDYCCYQLALALKETTEELATGIHKESVRKEMRKPKKKTPPQLLKEAREMEAAKLLAKAASENKSMTAEELGKILGCHKSTATRLDAWKQKGVLDYPKPTKGFKRPRDQEGPDIEAESSY